MEIDLINVAFDLGAGTRGSSLAPQAIEDNQFFEDLRELNHTISVKECQTFKCYSTENRDCKTKNLTAVIETCTHLAAIVDKSYSDNHFPMIIGGDHSILLGSLAGISKAARNKGEKIGVLYIDAHADFNTEKTTPSGNIHGECLSASCGLGIDELKNIYFKGTKINPENICIIGARSIDKGEKLLLKQQHIKVITMTDITAKGFVYTFQEALNYLSEKCDKIHISFDIDSVNPCYAPGTGIHIPSGLSEREVLFAMEELSQCKNICSADLVEVDPTRDVNSRTVSLARELILKLFGSKYF